MNAVLDQVEILTPRVAEDAMTPTETVREGGEIVTVAEADEMAVEEPDEMAAEEPDEIAAEDLDEMAVEEPDETAAEGPDEIAAVEPDAAEEEEEVEGVGDNMTPMHVAVVAVATSEWV
jgi:hypothetical protein